MKIPASQPMLQYRLVAIGPPNAIARLQREIANAMAELKPRFEAVGGEPMYVPPDRLKSYLQADYDKWIKVIREADIRLE